MQRATGLNDEQALESQNRDCTRTRPYSLIQKPPYMIRIGPLAEVHNSTQLKHVSKMAHLDHGGPCRSTWLAGHEDERQEEDDAHGRSSSRVPSRKTLERGVDLVGKLSVTSKSHPRHPTGKACGRAATTIHHGTSFTAQGLQKIALVRENGGDRPPQNGPASTWGPQGDALVLKHPPPPNSRMTPSAAHVNPSNVATLLLSRPWSPFARSLTPSGRDTQSFYALEPSEQSSRVVTPRPMSFAFAAPGRKMGPNVEEESPLPQSSATILNVNVGTSVRLARIFKNTPVRREPNNVPSARDREDRSEVRSETAEERRNRLRAKAERIHGCRVQGVPQSYFQESVAPEGRRGQGEGCQQGYCHRDGRCGSGVPCSNSHLTHHGRSGKPQRILKSKIGEVIQFTPTGRRVYEVHSPLMFENEVPFVIDVSGAPPVALVGVESSRRVHHQRTFCD